MAIHFNCPHCNLGLHAKDAHAGKKGKCPACRKLFRVPEGEGGGLPEAAEAAESAEGGATGPFGLDDLHTLADGEAASESTSLPEPPPLPSHQQARQGGYGLAPVILAPAVPEPAAPAPTPVRIRTAGGDGKTGAMSLGCLGAIGFAVKNLPAIFLLSIMFWLVVLGFYLLLPDMEKGPPPAWVMPALCVLALVIQMTLGGYFLRYLCDVADGTTEENDGAQPLPEWDFAKQIVLALRWIGMIIVYVLPVVTLPLMPLGCLALSDTRDGRAMNLWWTMKALGKAPGRFFALWGMLLFWGIVCPCIVVADAYSYLYFFDWAMKGVRNGD